MTGYRLEVADVFRQHKQEFFARWGHTLSTQQSKVFRDICACGTAALGACFARRKPGARREELPGSGKDIGLRHEDCVPAVHVIKTHR